MIYGLISDIHANLEAFDAVLEKLAGADAFVCMGDVVGYGPDPGPCIDLLSSLPSLTCIAGNHDLAAAGLTGLGRFNPHARHAIDWTMQQLSDDHKQYLARLRPSAHVEDAELVHGALPNYMDYITSPDEAMVTFAEMRGSLLFIGHTHVTECYRNLPDSDFPDQKAIPGGMIVELSSGIRYIINPGSVGQPRDGNPEASYGLYDFEARTVKLSRVRYDYRRTQRKMRRAGLPAFLVDRLSQGR